MPDARPILGTSPLRKEGRAKVLGQALYVDDLTLPGMWFGATVRSSIPRGRITSITFPPHIPWHEFTVVTAADIPGENTIVHLTKDHPCLADTLVNHHSEPILLLAHPDRARLPEAVAAVQITYEELPAVFSIEDSEALDPIIWGHREHANTFKTYLMQKGTDEELAHIFAHADHIVEAEYRTGAQEQLYIENNGIIAEYLGPQGVKVQGCMQCPFYVVHALSLVFDLPPEQCRVLQTETGGAFGGKEDFPSVIAAHAALLAMKSGHPVKICYDRAEDMAATTKRHPSRTRHRTAVSRDGKLLGGEIAFALDGGAYATLSPVVLSRGTIHAPGPYHWPALKVSSKAMATNIAPHGAFRGFGAPQSLFAIERHMDKIAKVVGLSPEELRRRNFLAAGGHTATGQHLTDPIDLQALLTRALTESDYHRKRALFDQEARTNPGRPIKRGIGFASFLHGAGFTGSGERRLDSLVEIELATEPEHRGRPRLLVSSTEFGQGTNTILCQVAAHTLGLPYEDILIAQPDTARVPNSGPTVASRTAMIVGKLVETACQDLLEQLGLSSSAASEGPAVQTTNSRVPHPLPAASSPERVGSTEARTSAFPSTPGLEAASPSLPSSLFPLPCPTAFYTAAHQYLDQHTTCKAQARYQLPPGTDIFWDDDQYKGDAYPTYAWAVYVAEIALDTRTYTATVTDFHALQEVGRVLHPILAAGQIEGGVAQGIGYALYEKCVYQAGRLTNNQMTNYIMPTSADLPPIHVHFEEVPSIHGPSGAKGIGELPMDGPAPAILNAIEHATGLAFTEIPLLPEDIYARMCQTPAAATASLDPATDRDTRVEVTA